MTLDSVVFWGMLLWLATNIMWAAFFIGFVADITDRLKKTRKGLRRLAEMLGFGLDVSWVDGEIYVDTWGHNANMQPAFRGDIEKFFKEHEDRLNAVYKYLGIEVKKKVTPAQPEKREIVVEKVAKK